MSALGIALKSLGHDVVGSDKIEIFFTDNELIKNDIEVLNFNEENIDKYKDWNFIVSYAYDKDNNYEVKRLEELGVKYKYYSEFINEFFKGKMIGVSGSHGKTTVSKMLASFLPLSSYIIGDGSGRAYSDNKFFVIEACEYKRHFLNYDFDYLIINNIDYDHPDYYKNKDEYLNAFIEASMRAKCLICNGDDENCKMIRHENRYTFGFNRGNNCLIKVLEENEKGYKVEFKIKRKTYFYELPYYGKHMIYNFACVLLLLSLENVDIKNIEVNKFELPRLRMSERIYKSNIIIDDYAHHPTEIKCIINAIRQKYPDREIICIFQPHTYTRSISLKKEFKNVFDEIEECYLEKTFVSREKYDKTKEKEVKKIFKKCKYLTKDDIDKINMYENKVILILGAGDIHYKFLKSFS